MPLRPKIIQRGLCTLWVSTSLTWKNENNLTKLPYQLANDDARASWEIPLQHLWSYKDLAPFRVPSPPDRETCPQWKSAKLLRWDWAGTTLNLCYWSAYLIPPTIGCLFALPSHSVHWTFGWPRSSIPSFLVPWYSPSSSWYQLSTVACQCSYCSRRQLPAWWTCCIHLSR